MAKRIYLDFLQYLSDHQTPNNHYFNRYFVLKDRLINEHGYLEAMIDRAKEHLSKSGFIIESADARPLYVTEEGIKFLHNENQTRLMGGLEKFNRFFNKKLAAVFVILGLLLAAFGIYYNAQKKSGDMFFNQHLSVSNNVKLGEIN